jgi:hypothetical protein
MSIMTPAGRKAKAFTCTKARPTTIAKSDRVTCLDVSRPSHDLHFSLLHSRNCSECTSRRTITAALSLSCAAL